MAEETRAKILEAAIDLMSMKGYSTTTTREIAKNAGVSEMTLFRKFNTKQEILDNVIERYTASFRNQDLFTTKDLEYDLEVDLANVSRTYQNFMNENKKVILLAYKESGINDDISGRLTANPRLMKYFLIEYLTEMKSRDKIIDIDFEVTVFSFMSMNLGFFSTQFISGAKVGIVPIENFIETSVKVFSRGLKK